MKAGNAVTIELCEDPARIATLNEEIQNLHVRLYPECFKPYSYEAVLTSVRSMLVEKGWKAIVAVLDGVDVGYALFYKREYAENPFRKAYTGMHIDQISVQPDKKQNGIGTAMMRWVESYALSVGASQLELSHWEKNIEAKNFYVKQGFETSVRFVVKKL